MKYRYRMSRVKTPFFIFPFLLVLTLSAAAYGQLSSVSLSAGDASAGSGSIHTVSFTTTNPIPLNGRLVVTYPEGFNLSSVNSVTNPTMDGTLSITVSSNSIILTRSGGTAQPPGLESVLISNVTNSTIAMGYPISVRTETAGGTQIDAGTALYTVTSGSLNRFQFGLISGQTAGTWFSITMTATDLYGNVRSDFTGTASLSFSSGPVTVQSTGNANTGNFALGRRTENVRILTAGTGIQITASGSGISGDSWYFNVGPAGADHFDISPVGTQSAGNPFVISVTARDAYDNKVIAFGGAGVRANISHTGSGSILPAISGDFNSGTWTGQVTISATQSADKIRVTHASFPNPGESNAFDVITSTVDHFTVTSIAGSKTAGVPFSVSITAQDANNNKVTSFNSTVNLTDLTGACTPQQMVFNNGDWSGTVTVTKSLVNNVLTATGVGKSSSSNQFNVTPAALDHFTVSNIASPQTAGTAFSVTLTAKDIFENTVAGFTGSVNLYTGSGTINPNSSGAFSGGVCTITTVTLSQWQEDAVVTVSDAFGHSGTSNKFNVIPGALHHFNIDPIADQATGTPFVVTVTAKDANNNTVTTFNGAGNTVSIVHSGTGAISPAASTVFGTGTWTGAVQIAQTQASDRITVTRSGGAQTGISNAFRVSPSTVDHFLFSPIPAIQTAGVGFSVTITAQDANNNTAVNFSGTANLDDMSGMVQPQQVQFTNGVWNNGIVTVTKAGAGNSLTVNGSGKSGKSNEFHVLPGAVQWFDFSTVASPKIAGTSFQLIITAKDQYGNSATSFNGTVLLTDVTNTISPAVSGAFSAGSINQSVTISRALNDVSITVNDGAGHSGRTNIFNVLSSSVDHFDLDPVGDQVARRPFILTVVAHDRFHNPVNTFTETVNISDLTGTVTPSQSGHFINGSWSGGVTIHPANQTAIGNRINVVRTLGTEAGSSTLFNVYAPPGVRVMQLAASRNEVTVNQEQDWSLLLSVRNLSSSEAFLDSLKLKFWLSGQVQSDYIIQLPATFKRSITRTLAGNSMDTLSVLVDRTGSRYGDILIEANVYFTDKGTNGPVSDQGKTGIVVQDSARLAVERIRVSQSEVSQGQEEDWTATMIVKNRGGSTVLLDSSRLQTYVQFSSGADWRIIRPASLFGGGWILTGGKTDSLLFFIDKTGTGSTGICWINAFIGGTENNTGRKLSTTSNTISAGTVKIEKPAQLQIVDVSVAQVPHTPYVNVNQPFHVLVSMRNTGGDGVHDVQVSLTSDGSSSYLDTPFKTLSALAGGGVVSFDFPVQASGIPNPKETFTVSIAGYVDNTGSLMPLIMDTTKAIVQNPAVLAVEKAVATVLVLTGGQKDPWYIKVSVRNTGQADLNLDLPQAEDISFWIGTLQQTDYGVKSPLTLKKGGLRLKQNTRDTLIYTVNHTGIMGGNVEIRARIAGKDGNSNAAMTGNNVASVFVNSDRAFRIMATQIQCLNRTDAGNGYVNINQNFRVFTVVENGFGQTLRNIKVRLRTNGLSAIATPELGMDYLRPSASDTLFFDVKADKKERASEVFTASIVGAELENAGFSPPVGNALDSLAATTIQLPARVALSLSLSNPIGQFSTNQEFTVTAVLDNRGTADIDSSGRIRISPPGDYLLLSKTDSSKIGFGRPVAWKIKAPPDNKSLSTFFAMLYRLPKDKNSGNDVLVEAKSAQVDVVTLMSSLYPLSFKIVDPPGAVDNVVSCGQTFVIRTQIQSKNTKNIRAMLVLPEGFTTADNLEKSALSSDLFWQVSAPSLPTPVKQYIQMTLAGVDSLQENIEVKGMSAALSVTVVTPARLTLDLTVLGPIDVVEDNTVSPGQEFLVGVTLKNSGVADTVGNAEVTLSPLPDGYGSSQPLTQILTDGTATWVLQAPFQQTGENVSITAQLIKVPKDENTDKDAVVIQAQDKIPIFIESAWLAVWRKDLPAWVQSVIQPGQSSVRMMVLELDNRGEEGANRIVVDTLRLNVEDRFGNAISPRSVLSSMTVVDGNDSTKVLGAQANIPEGNPVSIPLAQAFITTDKNLSLSVFGSIANEPEGEIFQLSLLGEGSVAAKDPYSRNPVPVRSPVGDIFTSVVSEPKKIFKPESEPIVWNYPNPFGGPGKEETKITYFMNSHQDVVFKLYTLAGELVWSIELPFSDPRTQEGNHTIIWNGRNERNFKVLNGVYLLFMKTADGKIEKTKIAIVK
jgi:hypothetical protein